VPALSLGQRLGLTPRFKGALQLLINRYGKIRFAQVPERISTKSFVVSITGNSKANYLGAQGTFNPNPPRVHRWSGINISTTTMLRAPYSRGSSRSDAAPARSQTQRWALGFTRWSCINIGITSSTTTTTTILRKEDICLIPEGVVTRTECQRPLKRRDGPLTRWYRISIRIRITSSTRTATMYRKTACSRGSRWDAAPALLLGQRRPLNPLVWY